MKQYLKLVKQILEEGIEKTDRTGTGTLSIFGTQTKYDLSKGFPLLTTKKVLFDGCLHELLWFLKGSTNINDGLTKNTPIWNAWADKNGELGPIYGYQWRKWATYDTNQKGELKKGSIDQIKNVIEMIKTNPNSRRLIVNAWNVADISKMALPPCHLLFQFYVHNNTLDCQLYQRSADVALGVPFNIASYSLLTMMVAQECGLTPGIFTHTIGDAHLYLNHLDDIKTQLEREPKALPQVKIAKKPFNKLTFSDFTLENYKHHPFIKFKVSI